MKSCSRASALNVLIWDMQALDANNEANSMKIKAEDIELKMKETIAHMEV